MRFYMNDRDGGPRGERGPRGRFDFGNFGMEWGGPGGGANFDPFAMFGGGERGRGGRGGGGGGGRTRRMFDAGELRLVLLKLIADQPRHGYDLIREIETLTGGAYAPSPGVVYPTLTMLDEMGAIEEQRSEGAKKRFAATEEGRAELAGKAEEVDALIARLTELGDRREKWDAIPVWRAFGNLAQVLRGRISRGGFTNETLHDIAELIDDVAQKIERLR